MVQKRNSDILKNNAKINNLETINESTANSQCTTKEKSELIKFNYIAKPDYSTWNKFLIGLLCFSILLPWMMNEMAITEKIIASFVMPASISVLYFAVFTIMNCRKVEIKDGKIHVISFLFGNYSLCSSDLIEVKYRLRNNIFELKERRNDELNNEYKIKMMSFSDKDVQKVLSYCHLIEKTNHISIIHEYL